MQEHRPKVPYLPHQVNHEMYRDIKELWWEICLKKTNCVKEVLLKIIQCRLINNLLRDCVKEKAQAHDSPSNFFRKYNPDSNCKHGGEYDEPSSAEISAPWHGQVS